MLCSEVKALPPPPQPPLPSLAAYSCLPPILPRETTRILMNPSDCATKLDFDDRMELLAVEALQAGNHAKFVPQSYNILAALCQHGTHACMSSHLKLVLVITWATRDVHLVQ